MLLRELNTNTLAGDFQTLSLFRICFSGYLLARFCFHDLVFFSDFYGDEGILPMSVLAAGPLTGMGVISPVLRALEALGLQQALPLLFPLAAVAFGVGYRTRWANAILFVLFSYLFWRNPYVRNGAEYLAQLLLLWCLFLPLDRHWSVDAALDPQPRDRPYPTVPLLAMRLQIGSLYVFAGLFKLADPDWVHGSAVIWSLQDNIFGAKPIGLHLVEHVPTPLYVVDLATIAFQLAFPLLVYCPFRNDLTRAFALILAAATHISFIFCLSVGGFPYLCLIMLLLLVPDAWLDRALSRRRARISRFAIFYEPDCGFCQRIALILREFLVPGADVRPASADVEAMRLLTAYQSWVVRDSCGVVHLKWRAMLVLLQQNPLLAPLAWLSNRRIVLRLFDALYDLIGRNRRALGVAARILLPFSKKRSISRPAQVVCGLLAGLALLINISSIERPAFDAPFSDQATTRLSLRLPHWVTALAVDLQVWQQWPLFAPPPHWRRDYRVVASSVDGTSVDLIARLPVPWFRLEASGRLAFADDQWLKYFTQLQLMVDDDWDALGRYLCRQARALEGTAPPVREVALTSSTRPIDDTPVRGMPPGQD